MLFFKQQQQQQQQQNPNKQKTNKQTKKKKTKGDVRITVLICLYKKTYHQKFYL